MNVSYQFPILVIQDLVEDINSGFHYLKQHFII